MPTSNNGLLASLADNDFDLLEEGPPARIAG